MFVSTPENEQFQLAAGSDDLMLEGILCENGMYNFTASRSEEQLG